MKRLSKLYFLLIPALVLFSSCEDEIGHDGEYVETPVVFGLLDKSDSLHYIKITHSFGGSNNAVNVALIPDSSYYQEIDVKIEEWVPVSANNGTLVKVRTWSLRDTILSNKAEGAFYSPDQKVYYFQTEVYDNNNQPANNDPDLTVALKQDATYKLVAVANGGEYTINSETKLVNPVSITYPSSLAALSFVTSTSSGQTYTNANVKVNVGSDAYRAQIVDARMKIYFKEYFNGVPMEKSFTWKLGELNGDQITETNVSFQANGNVFYNLIKDKVTNDANIDRRQLSKIEIIVTGGAEDLSKYILLSKPNSSLAQNKPSYTNLTVSDGRQAIGIFSSRHKAIQIKPDWQPFSPYARAIDTKSVRELCTGPITGSYLFCSDHPTDIAQGETYTCQ